MDNKEVEKVLEELQKVRPEKLTGEAKRLFEAIMIIADSRDKAEADLYEANHRISDLLDTIKLKEEQIEYIENEYGRTIEQKDKIIDEMAEQLAGIAIWDIKKDEPLILMSKEEVIKYYERESKNAKD